MNFVDKCKASAKEFKNTKSIIGCGMLSAIKIIVGMFSITLIPNLLRIGFSGHVLAVLSMFYGPVMGGISAIFIDGIEHILAGGSQGAYFPGFAFNACISAIIYGLFFYQTKSIKVKDVIICRFIVTLLVNLILTPIWLNIMYGSELLAIPRIVKNIIEFPIDCFILYQILKISHNIKQRM